MIQISICRKISVLRPDAGILELCLCLMISIPIMKPRWKSVKCLTNYTVIVYKWNDLKIYVDLMWLIQTSPLKILFIFKYMWNVQSYIFRSVNWDYVIEMDKFAYEYMYPLLCYLLSVVLRLYLIEIFTVGLSYVFLYEIDKPKCQLQDN